VEQIHPCISFPEGRWSKYTPVFCSPRVGGAKTPLYFVPRGSAEQIHPCIGLNVASYGLSLAKQKRNEVFFLKHLFYFNFLFYNLAFELNVNQNLSVMIDPTNFRKLNLDEKQNFTDEVLPIVKTAIGANETYKTYIAQVEVDNTRLVKTAATLSHPELTEEVNQGDELRDGGIGSLKINATRSLYRKDPLWVKAGQRILSAFNDFGNDMASRPIAKETTAVDKLLMAIENDAELKQSIATIQSNIWLQDIKDGQHVVKSAVAKRDSSKVGDEIAASDASRQLGTSLDKLFRYINMKIEFESNPTLVTLSFDLNKIIARYHKGIKLRATLREQKKQDKKKAQESLDND
jgi:hypothetical protein